MNFGVKFFGYCCCFVFFFFSSRRRHTRSKRDWSSDVCSSDLPAPEDTGHDHEPGGRPASIRLLHPERDGTRRSSCASASRIPPRLRPPTVPPTDRKSVV